MNEMGATKRIEAVFRATRQPPRMQIMNGQRAAGRVLPRRVRKKVYHSIGELQADLDAWIAVYNQHRSH
jgi:hypothetical protein